MIRELSNSEFGTIHPEVLWLKFREGDILSFEKIFRYYYRDLYGYGLKLSGSPELAKDAIQELFVGLLEHREKLSQPQSVKAYLLASLRRNILRTLGRQRRRNVILESYYEPGEKCFSAEDLLIEEEVEEGRQRQLKEAFSNLPERQREVLFLRYYNGMSYREIEEILSINYQSVRNNMYRALEKLRTRFKKEVYKAIMLVVLFFVI